MEVRVPVSPCIKSRGNAVRAVPLVPDGILHLLLSVTKHTAKSFYEDPLRIVSFSFPDVGKCQCS